MKNIFKIIVLCFALLILSYTYSDAASSKGGSFSGARMPNSSFKASIPSSTVKSKNSMSGSFGSKSILKKDDVMKNVSTQKNTSTQLVSSSKSGSFSSVSSRSNNSYTQKAYSKTDSFKTSYSKQPPVIQNFYTSSPEYGMWNTLFLITMLNSSNNSSWFYHHQNDENVKKFKEEYSSKIAENTDLKNKLTNMENEIIKLKEQGIKVDETYKADEQKAIEEYTNTYIEKEDTFNIETIMLMLLTLGCLGGIVMLFRK